MMVAENPWSLSIRSLCKDQLLAFSGHSFFYKPKRKSNLHSSCNIRDGQSSEAMGGLAPHPPQSEPRVIFIFNVRH